MTSWYTSGVNTNISPLPLNFYFTHTLHAPRYLTPLVVQAYRLQMGPGTRPLSCARFAEALRQSVPQLNLQVSPQTIRNWARGVHCPNFFFTLKLADHALQGTWQQAFARDLLAVQWPTLYEPGSDIGAKYVRALLDY